MLRLVTQIVLNLRTESYQKNRCLERLAAGRSTDGGALQTRLKNEPVKVGVVAKSGQVVVVLSTNPQSWL
jgi:hypothetical protein